MYGFWKASIYLFFSEDFDAANALLMIKSASKNETSARRRKMQKPMRNPRATTTENRMGSKSHKRKLKLDFGLE
jgi:hypothetical protein